MTIDAASGAIAWTPGTTQVGPHDVTVRATNSYGIDDQSFTVNVLTAATAPKITSNPGTTAVALQQYAYQVVASGSPVPTFSLTTSPSGMAIDAGRGKILWTPLRSHAGSHSIQVTAKNSAGQDDQSYTLIVKSAPLMTVMQNRTIKATMLFQDTAVADAFPAARYSFDFAPTGMTIDTASGAIAWTPTILQLGKSTVIVRATNSAGFDQANFDITVTDPTDVVASLEPFRFSVGRSYPNPVSAALNQGVFIPMEVQAPVTLAVRLFTTLGSEVVSFRTEVLGAGSHVLELPAKAPVPGTYYYSVTDGRAVHHGMWVVIP